MSASHPTIAAPPELLNSKELAAVGNISVYHLNAVGDMLFSLPPLLALRQLFPGAKITSIVRPHLRELLEPAHLIDEIILRPHNSKSAAGIAFVQELRSRHFDLAVLFSQSASTNLFALLSGAPARVGFIDTIFPWLLSHVIQLTGITCTAKLLYLTEWLGAKPQKRDYVGMLKVSPENQDKAAALLQKAGLGNESFAVFSFAQGPGAMPNYKAWRPEHFIELGQRLLKQGIRPVMLGAKSDLAEGQHFAEEIGPGAVSLAGKTSLGELAGVIQQAMLAVGIDSGPAHLAAALEVPLVALFGPTDPTVTGPPGRNCTILRHPQPCIPCRKPSCTDRPCITTITPEEVLAAAEKLIANQASGQS